MTHHEFNFNFHNTQFYGQYFQPEPIKGVVILVHGMGEHSGRYASFVIPKLAEQSLAVITYDQFGHGKTSGKKGHNPGYSYLLDTLEIVIKKAQELYPNQPIFLYGHSMGGNVAINYVLKRKHPFKGVIATSPLLRLAFQPPKWKLSAGKILQKIAPSITMPSELDANAISRNPEEVQKYTDDPLVHDKVSANYSLSVFDAGEWAITNAKQLSTPMLVIHGTADQLTDYKASREFVNNSQGKATLKLFDGGYHELHNDLDKEAFISTISDWIGKISP